MKKKVVLSPQAPEPIGPYSQAIAVEGQRLVFLSGQIPLRGGEVVGQGDVRAQTRQVMENLRAVLEAAGLTFDDVVKTTIYLTDMAHYPLVNEEYAKVFYERPPARAAVAVAGLPKGVDVEIECIAAS